MASALGVYSEKSDSRISAQSRRLREHAMLRAITFFCFLGPGFGNVICSSPAAMGGLFI